MNQYISLNKSKRFEVIKSKIISTKVSCANNTIDGEFRASRIHDQVISWTDNDLVGQSNVTLGYYSIFGLFRKVLCGVHTCNHRKRESN